MKGLLIRLVVSAAALYITAALANALNIGIRVEGVLAAVLAVIVLGVINALIRPLLILLTLPLNCLTLGLVTFIINALMFWLVGKLVPGFTVSGFWAAIFGSVVMGILSGLTNYFVGPKE
ncbi:MAG: phage holin family protein [Armatimonadota bacterium]